MPGLSFTWGRPALRAILMLAVACLARPAAADSHSIFTLSMDDTLQGAQGETPTTATGITFTDGMVGRAAYFGQGSQLYYSATGNINSREGTLMFWIRPAWNGNDNTTHAFARYGSDGGMVSFKDGANNLRIILNRYGNGAPETDVSTNISGWQAGQWRHVAYTWSDAADSLRLYVNGVLVSERTTTTRLNAVSGPTLQIGADGGYAFADADMDEVEISDVARSEQEISAVYLAAASIIALRLSPSIAQSQVSSNLHPTLNAVVRNQGQVTVSPYAARWETSDARVASVEADGTVHALGAGTARITAALQGFVASLNLTVIAPARPPEIQTADPYLTARTAGSLFDMPVAIIRYIPTKDGVTVDEPVADYRGTVKSLLGLVDQFDLETKFMLEEMSRFRGYKDASAAPSLGYRVVRIINVFEPLPPDMNPKHGTGTSGVYNPDYNAIMNRFDGRRLVEDLGVKEIWLWGYHHGNIAPVESDMSSPSTGDISNSYRFSDDLPIYGRTYTLYNYNFTRTSNESVHDHGHQLEAILGYTARRQDGNDRLFWRDFVGQDASGHPITGRCGNTHIPPNTTADYDYQNTTPALTDIEDWRPDNSGAKKMESAATWGAIPYQWPYGRVPDDPMQHNWYIYWGQAMPGWGNVIPYGANRMTNWWMYTGDWNAATSMLGAACGLYAGDNTVPPTVSGPVGSSDLAAGAWLDLSVSANGPGRLGYQWRKGGRLLTDGERIQGARTSRLRIQTEGIADSGGYDVVVICGHGMVASPVVTVGVAPAVSDAARALRIAAGLAAGSADEVAQMDLNRNHRLDLADASLILRAVAGPAPGG